MALNVKLSEFRTRVRYWSDASTGGTSDHYASAEVDYRINKSIEALYDLLVQARGHEFYSATSAPMAVTSGVGSYPLPADFYQLVSVLLSASSQIYDVPTWTNRQKSQLLNDGISGGGGDPASLRYRVKATSLQFLPTPTGTGWTFTLDYIPRFTELTGPDDAFDGVNGWEEWAVLDCAMGMLAKDSDTEVYQMLGMKKAEVEARIKRLAPDRDAEHPERVQDVLGDFAGSDYGRGRRTTW